MARTASTRTDEQTAETKKPGINPKNPDGTDKSKAELLMEFRALKEPKPPLGYLDDIQHAFHNILTAQKISDIKPPSESNPEGEYPLNPSYRQIMGFAYDIRNLREADPKFDAGREVAVSNLLKAYIAKLKTRMKEDVMLDLAKCQQTIMKLEKYIKE